MHLSHLVTATNSLRVSEDRGGGRREQCGDSGCRPWGLSQASLTALLLPGCWTLDEMLVLFRLQFSRWGKGFTHASFISRYLLGTYCVAGIASAFGVMVEIKQGDPRAVQSIIPGT